jgi:hypothetical protein
MDGRQNLARRGGIDGGLTAAKSESGFRKRFFFEKKNQKTFIPLGRWWFHPQGVD